MKNLFVLLILSLLQILKYSSSFTISCNFNSDRNWITIGRVYTCMTYIVLESSNAVTNVTGTHLPGFNNSNVKVIEAFGNNTLSFFPRNFSQHFPNLIGITLKNTTIETLYGDEIDEYGELFEWFAFGHSNLITISSNLFMKTPNVVSIFFFNTKLEHVGHNLFTPLNITQLKHMNFQENICINQIASSQTQITTLINTLQIQCPFENENLSTTTTTTSITETTTQITTTESSTCIEGNIDDFVCELNENFENEIKNLKEDLNLKTLKINELKNELQWIKEELLRLTTHPCACK
ncbi:hypothetical protein PVAND_014684 [Polypedilum vanderplanki]|uniref:Uncharacterized protein n=1 Tax=Polypedilum vanderplanki TaxID=319348 RepID=A0A9J6BAF1_POLVA|nr:hypothetical protein PVAND_014684 [Polypedilum vanderplanki]